MRFLDRAAFAATRRVWVKPAPLRPDSPVASLTFDDFPRSAWTVGGPILARRRVRATYYVSGRFCGRSEEGLDYYDTDDLRAVHAAGHEVACHSFHHRHQTSVSNETLTTDLDDNAAFVREVLGDVRLSSFAYPYGEASPRTKALAARAFPTARGIYPGINVGWSDLAQLRAAPLERRSWSAEEVERLVAEAKARSGWLIFFSHDVSDDPSPYGCTPAMLEHLLETLEKAGIEALPVKSALARASFKAAA